MFVLKHKKLKISKEGIITLIRRDGLKYINMKFYLNFIRCIYVSLVRRRILDVINDIKNEELARNNS